MPRKTRVILANMLHHIVQRGHNRKAVFVEAGDYLYYLSNLRHWKQELGVRVYGFCQMTNHVHLMVEPGDDVNCISQLMKQLAARQTRWVNRKEGRSGSLWEGRYKISAIQRERYLLQCCRYVERNPVKACMVQQPAQYPWSSYRARVGQADVSWLDFYECYLALGTTMLERQAAYRQYVETDPDADESALIQRAVSRCQLTGSKAFVDEIELRIGIRIEHRVRGRPGK